MSRLRNIKVISIFFLFCIISFCVYANEELNLSVSGTFNSTDFIYSGDTVYFYANLTNASQF